MAESEIALSRGGASGPQNLGQLITASWMSQAVYAAAKLGIADLLTAGPKTSAELATATGMQARPLYRLLRALACHGLFRELDGERFELTPMAQRLRTDDPHSQRWLAIMAGEEHYRAWGEILHSLKTGQPAFDHLFGEPVFDYLSKHPEAARVFDGAMSGVHGVETAAMLAAYDFSGMSKVVDVGGGNGSVLVALLGANPKVSGVLFDLPHVVERSKANFAAAGLTGRTECVGANFFVDTPPSADAYLLRHIIHDWDDEKSITILRNVRKAMSATSRILVVEMVIPPGNEPSAGKVLDLTMMVIPGGMERTEEEYRRLFATAGLKLSRIVPTRSDVSLVEAVPA